jgi:hypothetical protein
MTDIVDAYYFGKLRKELEVRTADLVRSATELQKIAFLDVLVILIKKVKHLLKDIQDMDCFTMEQLKSTHIATEVLYESMLSLHKLDGRYVSCCSLYNEVLQVLLANSDGS